MGRGISRESAVAAALELVDDVGLDGLTLRGLAQKLGVQAPALYWHFASKQDLLDEMGTQLWRDVQRSATAPQRTANVSQDSAASSPADWRTGMRSFAVALRGVLLSHRDGAKLFSGTYLTDVTVLEAQEEPLAELVSAGFALEAAVDASNVLYSWVVGTTIEEQAVRQAADRYDLGRREQRLDPKRFPMMTAAGRITFGSADERFERILARLIDGFDGWRR